MYQYFSIFRQRMPSNYSYFYRSPEHSDNVVLSFTFAFDIEEGILLHFYSIILLHLTPFYSGEKYNFALAYPYSYSRIKAIETRLAKRTEVVRVEPFATSPVSQK
jgi:hypothetical protein